jgi:hypothetical protein
LALERTENVKSDQKSLTMHEHKQAGKKLLPRLFEESDLDLKAELAAYTGEKRAWVEEGLLDVLLLNIQLPNEVMDLERLETIKKGFAGIIKEEKKLNGLFSQVGELLNQYLDNKTKMIEGVRKQFEGRIRQKEQELSRQRGAPVRLDPAQDPDFAQYLKQNMQHLQKQYSEVLTQVRQELTRMYKPLS